MVPCQIFYTEKKTGWKQIMRTASVASTSLWCNIWSTLAHYMIPDERIFWHHVNATLATSWSNSIFTSLRRVLGLPAFQWIVWPLAERCLASSRLSAIVVPAWLCSRGSGASVGIPQQVSIFNGTCPWIDECVVLPTRPTTGPSTAWVDNVWLMLSNTEEPDAGSQQSCTPKNIHTLLSSLPFVLLWAS